MGYVGIDYLFGLNRNQWKIFIFFMVLCLMSGSVAFMGFLKYYGERAEAKELSKPFIFTGDFPETLNEKRSDVMIVENFESKEFDHYVFIGGLNGRSDFNVNIVNWQRELPQINAWFIDDNNDKVNISDDISFRDGKMVIYFATTEINENTSWKYKGGKYFISMKIIPFGFEFN